MRDSELDEMSVDEFNRKYDDTLTEIKAMSLLKGDGYGTKPNHIKHHENRGISSNPAIPIPGKKMIDREGFKKQQENTKNYVFDAIEVRKKEILDREEVPMTKLLDLAIKLMPTKIEGEVEHHFTYGDMIMKAAQNLEKAKAFEAIAESAEDVDFEET